MKVGRETWMQWQSDDEEKIIDTSKEGEWIRKKN